MDSTRVYRSVAARNSPLARRFRIVRAALFGDNLSRTGPLPVLKINDMDDAFTVFLRQMGKRPRVSPKTAARRAAAAQARKRTKRVALRRRLQGQPIWEPRPELLSATKHDAPVEVPAPTLTPSPEFLVSAVDILDPDDVHRFAARCLGEEHHLGMPLRSFCPLHPSLEERALTLVEYRAAHGAVPLVHCRRCGYTLPLLDFVAEVGVGKEPTMTLAALTWPETVRSGIIDETVIEAVCQHRMRRVILGAGRWLYASMVVDDAVRPAFGDWAGLPDESLRMLLARETIPPEFRQDVYLLNILRNWMGEVVAVDVYAQEDYRPLFRHWLVSRRGDPLFAVPLWGACCDPTRKRDLVRDAVEGHALEQEASRQSLGSRHSVWLRSDPQPISSRLEFSDGRAD